MFEKLTKQDFRRIAICICVSVVSLVIVQSYFTKVFPDASIKMDVTKDEAQIIAEKFIANRGQDVEGYMHASRFGWLDDAKRFLEFELPADSAGSILNNTNSYYWRNRWFVPEQKEEFWVKISTTGHLAEFDHRIDEDAPGDSLTEGNAKNIAQFFLVGSIGIEMDDWELVEAKTEKQKNRWDHEFEWKEKSFNINESTHRITVKVQGSVVDYYNEWIKVPDTWKRKYQKIRSKNDLLSDIGGTGIILTLFLIFIMIFVRSRKNDIRWKTALIYGGIAGVLLLLMQLNNLPLQMYNFDNKDSYASFLAQVILLQCILLPMVIGLAIGLMVAGSEPLYRDQYPHHISFRHLFSAQGIKSRSFFNSAIIGISLTFVTFAFQTIYYLISNNLGGWSPRDVPNFDQYATYIPWIGVLLVGFFPAIQEESISRMFSIPFLQKYTKSTIFAVLFSSIIWGIAHANYPAQPFYIRAIEVSAIGVFVSWIFIRYGILATLIWHFSVNAFYQAMILLRSSNAYFITTGAVCAGLVLFPLIYAIISYRKNGGFVSSDHLVNALDTEIVEEKSETKELIDKTRISISYNPLSSGRVKLGLGLGIIGILLYSFISISLKSDDPIYNFTQMDKNRTEATKIAREYLAGRGFNLDGYQSVVYSENWLPSGGLLDRKNKYVAYIMENGGKDKLRQFLSEDYLGSLGWSVRFFIPETKKEYKVFMLAKEDETKYPHFRETLSDTAYLPYITQVEALQIVREFAENSDIDLSNMELTKEEVIERENRTDYHFKFKGNEDHKATIGEANQFFDFKVYGDHIGNINGGIKLPEAWDREYQQDTLYDWVHRFCFGIILLFIAILGIRYLLQLIKDNNPNWKFVLYFAGFAFMLVLVDLINDATFLHGYKTENPINIYIFQEILSLLVGGIFFSFLIVLLVLSVHLAWPNFFSAFNKKNRKIYIKDAFVSFLCSIGLFTLFSSIGTLLTKYHPSFIETHTFHVPRINSHAPLFSILADGVEDTIIFMLIIVGIVYIYNRLTAQSGRSKILILSMIALPFILPAEPEILDFAMRILWFGSLLLLVRYFWRFNPISFLFGAFCV